MHLSKLKISNFRAIKEAEISFQKGVNILIGENNAGKSAVIDALRIGFGYGKTESSLYIKESDLYIDRNDSTKESTEIQFDLIFEIGEFADKEKQCFYDFISQDPEGKQTIQLHLKYTYITSGKRSYFKRSVWGGDNEGQNIPYEALQEIYHTYLDPLRDAVVSLRPYSYTNKLGILFNELTRFTTGTDDVPLNDEKKQELATELNKVFQDGDWKNILQTGNDKVNQHLKGTGIAEKYPDITMNYVGREFSDVVKGIELKRPVYKDEHVKEKFFEISQNGLGENNLIYTSVVLGDLVNRCEDPDLQIYNALLVEEPEAHLHPQLQNRFFSYLNKLEDNGAQIFITSHSPTITAKTGLDKLIVLQKQDDQIAPFCFVNLSEADYSKKNRNHLKKFLDVTRSQMFFANGVLFVEGLAEALLLPVLSKIFLGHDLEKYGVEIVNINGVAFEHFAKLYNNEEKPKRLLTRAAIITDSDPKDDKAISDRAVKARSYEAGNLKVRLAADSFEFDLFEESDKNRSLIQEVYRTLHPKTEELKEDFSLEIFKKRLNEDFRDKGDLALSLSNKLESVEKEEFDVPDYIRKAVEWVVKGTWDV